MQWIEFFRSAIADTASIPNEGVVYTVEFQSPEHGGEWVGMLFRSETSAFGVAVYLNDWGIPCNVRKVG